MSWGSDGWAKHEMCRNNNSWCNWQARSAQLCCRSCQANSRQARVRKVDFEVLFAFFALLCFYWGCIPQPQLMTTSDDNIIAQQVQLQAAQRSAVVDDEMRNEVSRQRCRKKMESLIISSERDSYVLRPGVAAAAARDDDMITRQARRIANAQKKNLESARFTLFARTHTMKCIGLHHIN